MTASSAPKVVLAYSGGLDTSVIVRWLADKGYRVVCCTVDTGQREAFGALASKAKKSGAVGFHLADVKEEFVRDFVFKAIQFNARYEDRYLLGTSLARPVQGKAIVEMALREKADFIAHGATGKGNDQVRFELTAAALAPQLKIIAPWRDQEFRDLIPGRLEAIDYAKKHHIPIKVSAKKPWSSDENALHISFEAGMLEDPDATPLDDMFELSVSPKKAPDKATRITVDFVKGVPVAVNGNKMSPYKLLMKLNDLGGKNGIGRIDMVESRFVGMKSRGVYETPGGTILMAAHRDLEALTLDRGVIHLKDSLMPRFAQLVYFGFWFAPEMRCLMKLLEESQQRVTGQVRLELYKGNVTVIGRTSPYSLYNADIATMEKGGGSYNQDDATGFIRLNALPLKLDAMTWKKGK